MKRRFSRVGGKAETQEEACKEGGVLNGAVLNLAVGEIMHRMHMMSELGLFPVLCTKVQVTSIVGPLMIVCVVATI